MVTFYEEEPGLRRRIEEIIEMFLCQRADRNTMVSLASRILDAMNLEFARGTRATDSRGRPLSLSVDEIGVFVSWNSFSGCSVSFFVVTPREPRMKVVMA